MMKKIILLISVSVLMLSCERKTETLGPNLSDIYGEFQFFEEFAASKSSVDFTIGETVEFTCVFSKQVKWEIHIVGQNSGAEKVLSGFTNRIDIDNNGLWDGSITSLPMFKLEDCLTYLRIDDVDTSFSDTLFNLITVNGTKSIDGYVITDFEEGLNPGFSTFIQTGADMRFDTVTDPKGPQGNAFYETSGDVNFIDDLGTVFMPKSAFTDSNFTLSTNSLSVYFNVFAKKGPDAQQDIYVVQFYEDDNEDGSYNAGADDMHEYIFQDLSEDWVLFSTVYEDLVTANAGGGGQKNPDKLIQIDVIPIGARLPFEGFLDFMIFTENGPLEP